MNVLIEIARTCARSSRNPFTRTMYAVATVLAFLLAFGWAGTWPGHVGVVLLVLCAVALGVSLRDDPPQPGEGESC